MSRYFLITPKLLTDLEYHPRMRILNVVNGSHSELHQKHHADGVRLIGKSLSTLARSGNCTGRTSRLVYRRQRSRQTPV